MKKCKHIEKVIEIVDNKLSFEFIDINENERIIICDDYVKYTDYDTIEYYNYGYCILYNFYVIEEDTEFIIDDDNGYYITKGDIKITKELITTFEDIYRSYQSIKTAENRDIKLKDIL